MNIFVLFNESNTLSEVLKKMNLSDNSKNWKKVKEIAINIGFDINVYNDRKKRFCLKCGQQLKRSQKKFCCRSCSVSYNNIGRNVSEETKENIKSGLKKYVKLKYGYDDFNPKKNSIHIQKEKKLLKCLFCGKESNQSKKYCSVDCSNKGLHLKNYQNFINNPNNFNRGNYTPKAFKDFILNEQNGKCDICGCDNKWNNNNLIFVLDHIDGDASNNRRDNLRLVCPNCDSQLPTFKSKNKNSVRRNFIRNRIEEKVRNEYKLNEQNK